MDITDILLANSPVIPPAEYPGQSLAERVDLLPDASAGEESCDDLAKFLTAKQVLDLAVDYFQTGNLAETARKHRVRYPIALRASKELIFEEELASLERQLKIQQRARLDELKGLALEQLAERLRDGDPVMTKEGMELMPVKARDLAAIAESLSTRRDKLEEETKPVAGANKSKLETLAETLRARAAANATNAKIVPLKQISEA